MVVWDFKSRRGEGERREQKGTEGNSSQEDKGGQRIRPQVIPLFRH